MTWEQFQSRQTSGLGLSDGKTCLAVYRHLPLALKMGFKLGKSQQPPQRFFSAIFY